MVLLLSVYSIAHRGRLRYFPETLQSTCQSAGVSNVAYAVRGATSANSQPDAPPLDRTRAVFGLVSSLACFHSKTATREGSREASTSGRTDPGIGATGVVFLRRAS